LHNYKKKNTHTHLSQHTTSRQWPRLRPQQQQQQQRSIEWVRSVLFWVWFWPVYTVREEMRWLYRLSRWNRWARLSSLYR